MSTQEQIKWIVFVIFLLVFASWFSQQKAHADANSYLAYLADHHVNTAINTPARNLDAGFYACNALHAGQTPDQIVGSQPFAFVDIRGMIDAAQHELCPDTLH
jgi:Protein of unknown function (DUF732)